MCIASMNVVKRVKHASRKVAVVAVLAVVLAVTGCGGAFSPPQTGGIDFTMAVTPGAQTAGNGNGARYTVTVAPPAMIGFVNLSVSGLPAGVNAAFSPGFDVNGSRDLNVFTTATTPQGNAQLTITASDPKSETRWWTARSTACSKAPATGRRSTRTRKSGPFSRSKGR